MSADNPEKALAALLPEPVEVPGTGETVKPFTLALYAVLDRLGSPLLREGAPADALELLPSLYAVCRGPRAALESKNLLLDAVSWADALPPDSLPAIRDAAARQIDCFVDVAPRAKKENGTPDTTAG
ncbi:MAG: hypothetical protein IJ678_07095 [Kiritimatiellae bacterium]|nr:hypothetical protein [Kiritimatiellia bacterium]